MTYAPQFWTNLFLTKMPIQRFKYRRNMFIFLCLSYEPSKKFRVSEYFSFWCRHKLSYSEETRDQRVCQTNSVVLNDRDLVFDDLRNGLLAVIQDSTLSKADVHCLREGAEQMIDKTNCQTKPKNTDLEALYGPHWPKHQTCQEEELLSNLINRAKYDIMNSKILLIETYADWSRY